MIRHPDAFERRPAAGADGVFNWDWTLGCFGEAVPGKKPITPMDFDGVVERKGNFLIFETKDPGVEVPDGQMITLRTIHLLGDRFTIAFIVGKTVPETACIWFPGFQANGAPLSQDFVGVESIRAALCRWYKWADRGGYQTLRRYKR